MKISFLKKNDIGKIKQLLSIYSFDDYGAYKILDKCKIKEYLFNRIVSLSKDDKNFILVAYENRKREIIGLIVFNFLSWDTQHFGFKMGKIDYLITSESYPKPLLLKVKLLKHLLKLCKNRNIFHLYSRIDTRDISSIHALETVGFKVMDTLVTYVFNRHKHNVLDIKEMCKVRELKEQDIPALVNISKTSFSRDRFHLDPHVPNKKADSLFGEWIKNSCVDKKMNEVFVAEKNNFPVGFLTFKKNRDIENLTGYKIAGHGLSAVFSKAKGAYPALVKYAIKRIILSYDFLEFDTQLTNYEVIKIWHRFGFDFIRAKHSFHKWIKD